MKSPAAPFLSNFPMMHPFIGESFGQDMNVSMLLVGESHYLPPDSSVHLNPDIWYNSSHEFLNNEEKEWISTSKIYAEAMVSNFSNKAHSIWGNSLWIINDSGPRYPDYRTASNHLATYNFFFRPAVTGNSLEAEEVDIRVANQALHYYLEILQPTAVAFLSRKAFDCLSFNIDLPHTCTPHPGCAWWNRPSAKYEGYSGRDVLARFTLGQPWKI